jgi:large subunit ribosomal protein L10
VAEPRAGKVAVVDEVRERFERTDAAILTEYRGLSVAELASLRRALRDAGADYKIFKNTLVRRATTDGAASAIEPLLIGPTAIAFVEADVAAVAKVLRDFSRTHPALVVKGSLVGGGLLDDRSTARLAELPSREVLLAQIAGTLAAPLRQFAGLLKALPQNFAYGLSALVEKSGGTASGEAEAPAAEAPAAPKAPETGEGDGAAAGEGEQSPATSGEENGAIDGEPAQASAGAEDEEKA